MKELPLPAGSNMPVQVKCVSFDLQPNIQYISPRSEYSAKEVDDSWYCRLELEAMVATTMDPANEGHREGGANRGLEKYTVAGSTRLEVHRVQVVAAVLREQRRQRGMAPAPRTPTNSNNTRNEELLAAAASRVTQECQELANIQGYNDEVEAYAGAPSISTDIVSMPKPGLFSGLSRQVMALKDLTFLEKESKQAKQAN